MACRTLVAAGRSVAGDRPQGSVLQRPEKRRRPRLALSIAEAKFEVAKARGGVRRIAAPRAELKRVQRVIVGEILARVPVHDACHGFVAGRSVVDYVAGGGRAMTAIRVEGPPSSVAHRCNELKRMLGKYGEIEELHTANSKILWREIADVAYFAENRERQIWRVSAPPAEGSHLALRILDGHPGEVFYDWAGGLIWLALDAADDAHAEAVRRLVDAEGGHATLVRADDDVRRRVPVFQPQQTAVAEITRRIKQGFDPSRVLNPGRMYDGI